MFNVNKFICIVLYCFPAAVHFRFQYENFKTQFDGIFIVILNFQMSSATTNGNEQSLKIQCRVADNKA